MMWNRMPPELERGIAGARAAGHAYVLVEQTRSLDIDGFSDNAGVVASFSDLAAAQAELALHFARLVDDMLDGNDWHDEPSCTLPVELHGVGGVRLVEQRWRKRKDATGFNAETVAVQLLELTR